MKEYIYAILVYIKVYATSFYIKVYAIVKTYPLIGKNATSGCLIHISILSLTRLKLIPANPKSVP